MTLATLSRGIILKVSVHSICFYHTIRISKNILYFWKSIFEHTSYILNKCYIKRCLTSWVIFISEMHIWNILRNILFIYQFNRIFGDSSPKLWVGFWIFFYHICILDISGMHIRKYLIKEAAAWSHIHCCHNWFSSKPFT